MEKGYTDTTFRKYGEKGNYQKTDAGWVKQVEEKQETTTPTKKEYTDEELAEYAKKASDESLRKAGAGRDERIRIAAKKEIERRKSEGLPEPEKSENPFDEGLEKGLFDEFPTRVFNGVEYINKGQGWEILEKGRKGEMVGTIKDWKGVKYQKQANGNWKPFTSPRLKSSNLKEVENEKVNSGNLTKEDLEKLPIGSEVRLDNGRGHWGVYIKVDEGLEGWHYETHNYSTKKLDVNDVVGTLNYGVEQGNLYGQYKVFTPNSDSDLVKVVEEPKDESFRFDEKLDNIPNGIDVKFKEGDYGYSIYKNGKYKGNFGKDTYTKEPDRYYFQSPFINEDNISFDRLQDLLNDAANGYGAVEQGDNISIWGNNFEVTGRTLGGEIKLKDAQTGIEIILNKDSYDKLGITPKIENVEVKEPEQPVVETPVVEPKPATISIEELSSMPIGSEISFNGKVNDGREIKELRYTIEKTKDGRWSGRGQNDGIYGGSISFENDKELAEYLGGHNEEELALTKEIVTEDASNVLSNLDTIRQMGEDELKVTFPYLKTLPKEGLDWGDKEKLASKNIKTLIKKLYPNVDGVSVRKKDHNAILVEIDNKVPNGVHQILDLFEEAYKQNPYEDGYTSKSTTFTKTFGGAKYVFVQRG